MAWTGDADRTLSKLAYVQRLAAALGLLLLRQRDATGLVAFDEGIRAILPARARLSQWHQLLRVMGELTPGHGTAAAPALRRVVDLLRRRGLVVFISDLLLDRELALRALKFLRHRGHQVLVLHVLDPAELELGGPAEARFEDPETGQSVTLRPRDWAQAYRTTVSGVVSAWRRSCRASGMQYHQITTDTPFGLALRRVVVQSAGIA